MPDRDGTRRASCRELHLSVLLVFGVGWRWKLDTQPAFRSSHGLYVEHSGRT